MAETTASDPISLRELRAELAARRVDLSDRQLKRLRVEGLLPYQGQRHRAGLRGSESVYPRLAVEQLNLVARLAVTERRFPERRILVRWHSGWVDPDLLRASLVQILDRASAQVRRLSAGPGDESDQADRLAQALSRSPSTGAMPRLVRQRLGHVADDAERVFYALGALTTGAPIEWENHNPSDQTEPLVQVFDRASGLDRARSDTVAGHAPLLGKDESTQELLAPLQEAGCFDLLDLARAVHQATHGELDQAFADALSFARVRLAFEAVQVIAGDDAAGLGSLTAMVPSEPNVWTVAMLVRTWLLLRPIVPPGALEALVEAAEKNRAAFELGLAIRRDLPQHAEFIGPDGAERLHALPPTERARVTDEIRSYVNARALSEVTADRAA
jgi:hypothetical protein